MLLPTLRADLEIYETYAHTDAAPLNVPMLALGGTEDSIVARADILAWRSHTTASFEADFFPGGHFFPQANLVAVASRVRQFLRANCVAGTQDPFEEMAVPY
jgi:surfactin synthase thioesterase subunit